MRLIHRRFSLLPIILLSLLTALGHASEEAANSDYPGYVPLNPSIVVNLDPSGRAKYLKVDIQCQVDSAEDAALLEKHMPLVRDRLISLLGGRSADEMRTTQQRDDLRAELLSKLREALGDQTGRVVVSAIYFTGFIIQ